MGLEKQNDLEESFQAMDGRMEEFQKANRCGCIRGRKKKKNNLRIFKLA